MNVELNKEQIRIIGDALKEKNEAAGIMVFGIFLGIAFIVSGVIQ